MAFGEHITTSPQETIALGHKLGKQAKEGSIFCFFGDLAAGKTTFIKGLVTGAADVDSEEVCSPTFTYLNIYEGSKTVCHFDLYRIPGVDEFVMMGFDEYLDSEKICCIEWSEKIEDLLPTDCHKVKMSHYGENKRKIIIS